MVSGLYYVSRQGETYICLLNETADNVVIGESELPGQHIIFQFVRTIWLHSENS